MARLARLVMPGIPYHVTQRGNRRAPTFFEDGDFALYRDLLADAAKRAGASVWAKPPIAPSRRADVAPKPSMEAISCI